MINKDAIVKYLTNVYVRLKDTKYATSDIEERLALSKMEVANLRAALLDSKDAKTADIYASKLKIAQEEYRRLLKISRQKKIV